MSPKHDEHDRYVDSTRGPDRANGDDRLGSSLAPMLLDLDDDLPTRDELTSRFFAEPPEGSRVDAHPVIEDQAPERVRFESPAFRERQRYLMRYVAGAVAAAGAICLAAFVRTATASDAMPANRAMARAAAMAAAAPASPEPAAAPVAAAPEIAVTAVPAPVTPLEAPVAVASVVASQIVPPERSAGQEKQLALAALERGNWGAAIAAAERSVHLDPADGQAWLILGGAYQQRGADGQAHRCYASCARLARSGGARAECVALAR